MALLASYNVQTNVTTNYPQAYIRIGSFQEVEKDVIVVGLPVYATQTDFTNNLRPIDSIRIEIPTANISNAVNSRTGIYAYLKTLQEFSGATNC